MSKPSKNDILQEWKGILVPFARHGIFAFSLVFWLFMAPGVYPCSV